MAVKVLSWPKSSFEFFCMRLWENPNELLSQPRILQTRKSYTNQRCAGFLWFWNSYWHALLISYGFFATRFPLSHGLTPVSSACSVKHTLTCDNTHFCSCLFGDLVIVTVWTTHTPVAASLGMSSYSHCMNEGESDSESLHGSVQSIKVIAELGHLWFTPFSSLDSVYISCQHLT